MKSSTINDLQLSKKTNWIAVEELLIQFNDLFNLLVEVHQEYNKLLDDDERNKDNDWFDVDSQAYFVKEKKYLLFWEERTPKGFSKGSRSFSNKVSLNSRLTKASRSPRETKSSQW